MNTCDNCKKTISESSFTLHMLHCHRHLTFCKCNQMIPIKDMPIHLQQFHSFSQCKKCGSSHEVWQESLHTCESHLLLCETCGLHLLPEQLAGHQVNCEPRTEQCLICMKFIKKSEINIHLMKNCMPGLNETTHTRPSKAKGRKNKKKDWVKIQFVRKNQENKDFEVQGFGDVKILEDRDRLVAENLMEEIIFNDLEREENFL